MIYTKYVYFRHPDKNDNPAAEDKFVEITQAYEVSKGNGLKRCLN